MRITGLILADGGSRESVEPLVSSFGYLCASVARGEPTIVRGFDPTVIVARRVRSGRNMVRTLAGQGAHPFEVVEEQIDAGETLTEGKLSLIAFTLFWIHSGAILLYDRPLTAGSAGRIAVEAARADTEKTAIVSAQPSKDDRTIHYVLVTDSAWLSRGIVNPDYDVRRPRLRRFLSFRWYALEICRTGPSTFTEMAHALRFAALRQNAAVREMRVD